MIADGDAELLEDMREEFAERRLRSGPLGAMIWYWTHVLHPHAFQLGRELRRRRHPSRAGGTGARTPQTRRDMMREFPREIRLAVRSVRRHPGFAAVVVVTLALGIGGTTAMYSLIRATVLGTFSYVAPDRIVYVWETLRQWDQLAASPANVGAWRERLDGFESLAAFRSMGFNLASEGPASRVEGARVTANYLEVFGLPVLIGRGLVRADDRPGAEPVAVLSHGLWQRLSGGDPEMVGDQIVVDSESHTIVGVMPPEFAVHEPGPQDIWIPGVLNRPEAADTAVSYRWHWLGVVGRLQEGMSLESASGSADAVAQQLAAEHPANDGWGINLVPLREQVVGDTATQLFLLTGAVSFLFLIALVNISNLLLARLTDRRGELALRLALGASRIRILRETAWEMLLLSGIGALIGAVGGIAAVNTVLAINPGVVTLVDTVRLDAPLGMFLATISLLTAFGVSILPVWRLGTRSVEEILRTGGRRSVRRGEGRVRTTLVGVESALATVLVAGAGLMIASMLALLKVDPGFDPSGKITFEINVPTSRYATQADADRLASNVTNRLRGVPGVTSAGFTTGLPFSGNRLTFPAHVEGQVAAPEAVPPQLEGVGPGYFDALGLEVRRGRGLTTSDGAGTARIVVINQTLAERYFEGRDPLGARMSSQDPTTGPWMTVVGVVADVRHASLRSPVAPTMYVPVGQMTFHPERVDVLIAGGGELLAHLAAFRAALADVDPDVPLANPRTVESVMNQSLSRTRFQMALLMLFAGLGLVLGAVGIYSVVSYGVNQRVREMGIRIALGAGATGVRRLVVRQGITPVLAGSVVGLAAAAGLSRFIGSWLFGVQPIDPATYTAVAALIGVTGLLATWVPARRATSVDPVVALRNE